MQKLLSVLILWTGVNLCSGQDKLIIPFQTDGGRPTISVKVGGGSTYRFIFDTGAGGTVVDESVVEAEKIALGDPIRVGSPGSQTTIEGHRITIPKVEAGSMTLDNLMAASMPLKVLLPQVSADGIIGLNSFPGYMVTLDFATSQLIFEKATLDAGEQGVVNTKPSRLIAIDIMVNGETKDGHIDSGSGYGINIPYEWMENLKFKKEPTYLKKGRTVGGEFDMYTAQLDGTVTIAGFEIKNPEVLLAKGGFTAVNFGSQFLKDYLLTVDNQSRLVRLKEQTSTRKK